MCSLVSLAGSGLAAPQPAIAQKVLIPRLTHPPALEDFLSMAPGTTTASQMVKITGFIQRNPHDGDPASKRTEAYLGYDEKNLYAVFVCFDDPAKVRARMSRREDIFDDDTVEIMLDTFHDRRRASELACVVGEAFTRRGARGVVGGVDSVRRHAVLQCHHVPGHAHRRD